MEFTLFGAQRARPLKGLARGALISPNGSFRYWLWRSWGESTRTLTWCCYNPSTADHEREDPTLRRMIAFSQRWGFERLEVVNLFAFRTPAPSRLRAHCRQHGAAAVIGPDNDRAIRESFGRAERVIAGWGTHGYFLNRDAAVLAIASDVRVPVFCLARSLNGHPVHPLARGRWRVANDVHPTLIQGLPADESLSWVP